MGGKYGSRSRLGTASTGSMYNLCKTGPYALRRLLESELLHSIGGSLYQTEYVREGS